MTHQSTQFKVQFYFYRLETSIYQTKNIAITANGVERYRQNDIILNHKTQWLLS